MSEAVVKRGRGRPKGSSKAKRGIGHNSGETLSGDAQAQVKAFSKRIIDLLGERDEVNEDIKAVFAEAKESGFDTKIMRKAIAIARRDRAAYEAEQEMIDFYLHAMVGDLLDALEPPAQIAAPEIQAPDEPTLDEAEFTDAA